MGNSSSSGREWEGPGQLVPLGRKIWKTPLPHHTQAAQLKVFRRIKMSKKSEEKKKESYMWSKLPLQAYKGFNKTGIAHGDSCVSGFFRGAWGGAEICIWVGAGWSWRHPLRQKITKTRGQLITRFPFPLKQPSQACWYFHFTAEEIVTTTH